MPTLPHGGTRRGIGLAINLRVVQLSGRYLLSTRSVFKGSLKRQTAKRVGINAHPTKRWHALGNWVGNQSACCSAVGWALAAHAFRVQRQPETANGETRGHKCPPDHTAARAERLGRQSIRVLFSRRVGTCCPRVPRPKAA